jgi:hypothetical protein
MLQTTIASEPFGFPASYYVGISADGKAVRNRGGIWWWGSSLGADSPFYGGVR